jgi:hypothetical protein
MSFLIKKGNVIILYLNVVIFHADHISLPYMDIISNKTLLLMF